MSASFRRSVALLAHQGGWDEILLVAGPIVVMIAVLAVAKRRVDSSFDADRADPTRDDLTPDDPTRGEPDRADPDRDDPDPADPDPADVRGLHEEP